ncbi:unnamed protein product, partial [Pylaiella littoralis]
LPRFRKGSLLAFTFLHTLTLGNNHIGNLQVSLNTLRLMRHLRYLDLSGNPVAEETGYRLLMIKSLPWLETLDMHKITDEERSDACRTKVPKSWEVETRRSHSDSVGLAQDLAVQEASILTKNETFQDSRDGSGNATAATPAARPINARRTQALLRKELGRMTCIVKQRRILLKDWFVAEDPRREEAVTQELFTRCLRLHGLWPTLGVDAYNGIDSPTVPRSPRLSTASDTGFLAGEVGLLGGILLETFRVPAPRRAVPLGRDAAYLGQSFVDYVSFCGAVEPKHGGRDLDNQSRVLDKAWKIKSKGSTSKINPLPGRQPAPQPHARYPPSSRSWDSRPESQSELHKTDVLPTRVPMACDFAKCHADGPEQLDHWEKIELKQIFEVQGGANTPPIKQLVTRTQVLSGLKKMILQGRRPRIFRVEPLLSVDDDSINNLSGSGNGGGGSGGGGGGGVSLTVTPNGSGRTNLDVLFDAAVALTLSAPSPSEGTVSAGSSREGAKAISHGSGGGGGGGEAQDGKDPKTDLGVLLRIIEDGVATPEGIGPLEWDWLSYEEAGDRARKLFRQAAHAQRRLLLISDDEDEAVLQKASRIREKIATLTRSAARLGTLASSSPSSSS